MGAASGPAAPKGRGRSFLWLLAAAMGLTAPGMAAEALPSPTPVVWGPWIPAQHPMLRWEGRVRFGEDRSAVFDWTAVRLHATVEASQMLVYVRLGENYLDVLLDGQRVAVLGRKPIVDDAAWAGLGVQPAEAGGVPVYAVQGLPPGRHQLVLSKRTGPNFGAVTLLGLRFDGAASLGEPLPAPERRIEFVGDSLTNAYGTEGPGKTCKALAPYENSSTSWARLCADALGADAQLLAYSGYGLVRNYGAAGTSSADPVPSYYPRQLLGEPQPLWDRSAFKPDLSVVFLGTNDYSTPPHPSPAAFDDAYAAFLDELRKDRPGLKILLCYPDDGKELSERVKNVVESQQLIGHWVEGLGLPQPSDPEFACDWHPKPVVHRRWAELAEAKIRKILKWQ